MKSGFQNNEVVKLLGFAGKAVRILGNEKQNTRYLINTIQALYKKDIPASVSLTVVDDDGLGLLHYLAMPSKEGALEYGRLQVAKAIIALDPSTLFLKSKSGELPIEFAIKRDDSEMVKAFLPKTNSILKDSEKVALLMKAFEIGSCNAAKEIFNSGVICSSQSERKLVLKSIEINFAKLGGITLDKFLLDCSKKELEEVVAESSNAEFKKAVTDFISVQSNKVEQFSRQFDFDAKNRQELRAPSSLWLYYQDSVGDSVFKKACAMGFVKVVDDILDRVESNTGNKNHLLEMKNNHGQNVLMGAVYTIVPKLIASVKGNPELRGSLLEDKDRSDLTALQCAYAFDDVVTVKAILNAASDDEKIKMLKTQSKYANSSLFNDVATFNNHKYLISGVLETLNHRPDLQIKLLESMCNSGKTLKQELEDKGWKDCIPKNLYPQQSEFKAKIVVSGAAMKEMKGRDVEKKDIGGRQ